MKQTHFLVHFENADAHDVHGVRKSTKEKLLKKLQRSQELVELFVVTATKIQHGSAMQSRTTSRRLRRWNSGVD
jgi:hypothetical protein